MRATGGHARKHPYTRACLLARVRAHTRAFVHLCVCAWSCTCVCICMSVLQYCSCPGPSEVQNLRMTRTFYGIRWPYTISQRTCYMPGAVLVKPASYEHRQRRIPPASHTAGVAYRRHPRRYACVCVAEEYRRQEWSVRWNRIPAHDGGMCVGCVCIVVRACACMHMSA